MKWPLRARHIGLVAAIATAFWPVPAPGVSPAADLARDYAEARGRLAGCERQSAGDPFAECATLRILLLLYERMPGVMAADTAALHRDLATATDPRAAARLHLSLIRSLHVRRSYQELRRELALFGESDAGRHLDAPYFAEIGLIEADARIALGQAGSALALLETVADESLRQSSVLRGITEQLRGRAQLALGDYPAAVTSLQSARSFLSTTEGGRLRLPEVMADLVEASAPINLFQAIMALAEIAGIIVEARERLRGQPQLPALEIASFRPAMIRACTISSITSTPN